jgi:hypothetical protein
MVYGLFQYPKMDRVGVGYFSILKKLLQLTINIVDLHVYGMCGLFQYPKIDRVGVGVLDHHSHVIINMVDLHV